VEKYMENTMARMLTFVWGIFSTSSRTVVGVLCQVPTLQTLPFGSDSWHPHCSCNLYHHR
jgi:hypothetical protein